jgi:NAD(P)H-nitrite reductase large subunit
MRAFRLVPGIVLRGLRYATELMRHGIALRSGVTGLRMEGETRVSGVTWNEGRAVHSLACDGVGYGLGLRPETQLADLAGCAMRFSVRDRAWLPAKDAAGRSSVAGVYLAGDGAGIAGADAAERAGERAALALAEDRGLPFDKTRAALLTRELAAIDLSRDALEAVFPFPHHWAEKLADDTLVCRCEEVDAGALRKVVRDYDLTELNRLKAITRIGMGRCQGRICAAAAAELLAQATGRPIETVGCLRAQAPVKPIPLTLAASADTPEAAE